MIAAFLPLVSNASSFILFYNFIRYYIKGDKINCTRIICIFLGLK